MSMPTGPSPGSAIVCGSPAVAPAEGDRAAETAAVADGAIDVDALGATAEGAGEAVEPAHAPRLRAARSASSRDGRGIECRKYSTPSTSHGPGETRLGDGRWTAVALVG